jgi:hypothetical protein
MQQQWPALRGSHLLNVQVIRAVMVTIHARAAVAAAAECGPRASSVADYLVNVARRDVRKLESEGMPYAAAFARLIRAGIAALGRDREAAIHLFGGASQALAAAQMNLFAAAASRHRAELAGTPEALAEISDCDAAMIRQGIHRPTQMARALAPSHGL